MNHSIAGFDLERAGRLALDGAVERAGDLIDPAVPVTRELRVGAVVATLVDLAVDARMIVLEHRALSRAKRVVTRSVASGVAAHARVPVVSVPSGWQPRQALEATVTVGVDVPDSGRRVLRAAADEAKSRGATLHVLHTWTFPSPYDDVAVSRTEDERWSERAQAEIEKELAGLGGELAGVQVLIEARHIRAADALVAASQTSDLIVVGRHDPLLSFGSRLGPVARAVLREADCPVLLADPSPSRTWRRPPKDAGEGSVQTA